MTIQSRRGELEATQQTVKFFETLLRASTDGIVITDTTRTIVVVNEAFCSFFGVRWREVAETSLFVWLEQLDGDALQCWADLEKHVRLEGVCRDIEFSLTAKDGYRHLSVNASLLERVADEERAIIISIWRESTKRKLAEEELQKAHDELEQRVEERTAELAETNEQLKQEIADRKRSEDQIQSALKEKEVLLREIHHRVKNNMQVITSLLKLQSGRIKEKQYADILKDSQDRIKSMALVHEKLYQAKDFAEVDFNGYIKSLANSLFRSYGVNPAKIALRIEVDDVSLGLDSAIPCGLIINELVSNALKYAFPEDMEGEIRVSLGLTKEDEFKLIVSDNGAGMPEHIDFRNTESLGLHLVTILAEKQLHGKIELNRVGGTKYHIQFKRVKEKMRI